MLSGSALLRVFLVVIAAAALTGLVQHYWVFDTGAPEPAAAVTHQAAPSPPARQVDPPQAKPATQASPQPPAPARTASDPPPVAVPVQEALPETRNAALPPTTPPAPPQPPPLRPGPPERAPAKPAAVEPDPGEQEVAAAEAVSPRAVDLVDLNTGSLADLNGLKGGGAIGRAIIQRRPYASVDQLISKRVLSRAIYQRIRDQVTVR